MSFHVLTTLVWLAIQSASVALAEDLPISFQIVTKTAVPDPLLKSPDGKLTVGGKSLESVQLIATSDQKPAGQPLALRPITRNYQKEVKWAFSPDGRLLAASLSGDIRSGGDTAAHVRVWDDGSGKLVAEATPSIYNHLGYVLAMAFSEDSEALLIRCEAISGK